MIASFTLHLGRTIKLELLLTCGNNLISENGIVQRLVSNIEKQQKTIVFRLSAFFYSLKIKPEVEQKCIAGDYYIVDLIETFTPTPVCGVHAPTPSIIPSVLLQTSL